MKLEGKNQFVRLPSQKNQPINTIALDSWRRPDPVLPGRRRCGSVLRVSARRARRRQLYPRGMPTHSIFLLAV